LRLEAFHQGSDLFVVLPGNAGLVQGDEFVFGPTDAMGPQLHLAGEKPLADVSVVGASGATPDLQDSREA
jgi:hypothetical protein